MLLCISNILIFSIILIIQLNSSAPTCSWPSPCVDENCWYWIVASEIFAGFPFAIVGNQNRFNIHTVPWYPICAGSRHHLGPYLQSPRFFESRAASPNSLWAGCGNRGSPWANALPKAKQFALAAKASWWPVPEPLAGAPGPKAWAWVGSGHSLRMLLVSAPQPSIRARTAKGSGGLLVGSSRCWYYTGGPHIWQAKEAVGHPPGTPVPATMSGLGRTTAEPRIDHSPIGPPRTCLAVTAQSASASRGLAVDTKSGQVGAEETPNREF